MKGVARALSVVAVVAAAVWASDALQGIIWRQGQTCNFDTGPLRGDYTGYVQAERESDGKKWTTEVFTESGYVRYEFPLPTQKGPEFNYWYRLTGQVGNYILCERRFYYSYGSWVCDLIQYPSVGGKVSEE